MVIRLLSGRGADPLLAHLPSLPVRNEHQQQREARRDSGEVANLYLKPEHDETDCIPSVSFCPGPARLLWLNAQGLYPIEFLAQDSKIAMKITSGQIPLSPGAACPL